MIANTVSELYAQSQWRFALMRDDEYVSDEMVMAIEIFAGRVRQAEMDMDGFMEAVHRGAHPASQSGRRGAISE